MFEIFGQNDSRNRFLLFIAISLAVHLSFFWQQMRDPSKPIQITRSLVQEVQVIPMTKEEWDKKVKEKKQIVQSEDRGINEKPKDEAFLSDKNRAVERETMARHIDVFNEAGIGNANVDTKEQQKSKSKKEKKIVSFSDLGVGPADSSEMMKVAKESSFQKSGMKSGEAQKRGIGSTNDYVEHMKLGDFTQMNTVEYKNYGFFHRIRQKLEQFWGRSIHEKADALFKSGRRLPANENLTTSLRVTLNSRGEITKVVIQGTSGVRELDDAATESFNKAGPFPNPPSDMLVNGEATIEWGFVVNS